MGHDRVLWFLQWVSGIYFIAVGVLTLALPEVLFGLQPWMYDLLVISATVMILGGIGLILPGLVKVRPELTPLAAVVLIVAMFGAIAWNIGTEEFAKIGPNLVSIVALSYIAYGRWRIAPLAHRSRINTL